MFLHIQNTQPQSLTIEVQWLHKIEIENSRYWHWHISFYLGGKFSFLFALFEGVAVHKWSNNSIQFIVKGKCEQPSSITFSNHEEKRARAEKMCVSAAAKVK